ncbi:MAG: GAF domain-containing sensor histidine kinase [Nitriliruptoraceae bacterium]
MAAERPRTERLEAGTTEPGHGYTAILAAVGEAAERFLDRHRPWQAAMPDVLAALGHATGASRAWLFEVQRRQADEAWVTQRFHWSGPGLRSLDGEPALAELPMVAAGLGRWVPVLDRGEPVYGRRRSLPVAEQPHLQADGVLSLAVLPIMVDGRWWGMLALDDRAHERTWAAEEIDGLQSAARIIAAAIRADRADATRDATRSLLQRRLQALSTVAESLTVDRPIDDTMDAICRIVSGATRAEVVSIVVGDPDTGELQLSGAYGLSEGYRRALLACWEAGAVSPQRERMERRETQWVPDAPRQTLDDPAYAPLHPHLRQVRWQGLLVLPLDSLGRHIGAVSVAYLPGIEPDEAERAFLEAVAAQAAAAVENARVFARMQHAAALDERQRIARELHDSVSQALYGITLGARTARTLAEREPAKVVEPLDYVLDLAEAGLAEMRALIFELRPEALEREGLTAALERQARVLRTRHGVEVDMEAGTEPAIDLPVKEVLYRVAQEALHNIVKHAGAQTVRVRLGSNETELSLEITDDGVGFDPVRSYPGHMGLQSMRERVEGVAGTFTVSSTTGHGTRILARVPTG